VKLRYKKSLKRPLRIGIYAGAFDPVHAGHVAFALQAVQSSALDQVVFMPERRPRSKPSVEHYAHRVAMLKAALAPHPNLAVMEVVDRHFTVRRILPLLQVTFPDAQLVLLMGSDTIDSLPLWPYVNRLLSAAELVVGLRADHNSEAVEALIADWPLQKPSNLVVFNSYAPDVSSSRIRQALRTNQSAKGLLASVRRYSRQEWLYASPAYAALK